MAAGGERPGPRWLPALCQARLPRAPPLHPLVRAGAEPRPWGAEPAGAAGDGPHGRVHRPVLGLAGMGARHARTGMRCPLH